MGLLGFLFFFKPIFKLYLLCSHVRLVSSGTGPQENSSSSTELSEGQRR